MTLPDTPRLPRLCYIISIDCSKPLVRCTNAPPRLAQLKFLFACSPSPHLIHLLSNANISEKKRSVTHLTLKPDPRPQPFRGRLTATSSSPLLPTLRSPPPYCPPVLPIRFYPSPLFPREIYSRSSPLHSLSSQVLALTSVSRNRRFASTLRR